MKLNLFRKRKPEDKYFRKWTLEEIDSFDKSRTFTVGGGWGCHISWLINRDKLLRMPPVTAQVYGHLSRRPTVGDLLIGDFEKTTNYFVFTEVELQRDPPDMFFGNVMLVCQKVKGTDEYWTLDPDLMKAAA